MNYGDVISAADINAWVHRGRQIREDGQRLIKAARERGAADVVDLEAHRDGGAPVSNSNKPVSVHTEWIEQAISHAFLQGADAAFRREHGRLMTEAERDSLIASIEVPYRRWLRESVLCAERDRVKLEAWAEAVAEWAAERPGGGTLRLSEKGLERWKETRR